MNVKEIFNRNPPKTLYHYTTQLGLLGIVGNKEIWASHTQYLNDAREYRHAVEVVREELSIMRKEALPSERKRFIDEMEKAVEGAEGMNVCVCSFSENGDVLSQWRAYADGGSGFALGFCSAFLRSVTDEMKFWLVPVLYQEHEQRHLIRTLLSDVIAEKFQIRAKSGGDYVESLPLGGNLLAYLNRYAPILKHRSFSEEREWRIISRPLFCSNTRFGYRPGASMLVPYFRIPLCSEKINFKVEEIVVGPTPHPHESRAAVRGLMIKHELEEAQVRISETPYRNW